MKEGGLVDITGGRHVGRTFFDESFLKGRVRQEKG